MNYLKKMCSIFFTILLASVAQAGDPSVMLNCASFDGTLGSVENPFIGRVEVIRNGSQLTANIIDNFLSSMETPCQERFGEITCLGSWTTGETVALQLIEKISVWGDYYATFNRSTLHGGGNIEIKCILK